MQHGHEQAILTPFVHVFFVIPCFWSKAGKRMKLGVQDYIDDSM